MRKPLDNFPFEFRRKPPIIVTLGSLVDVGITDVKKKIQNISKLKV